MSIPFIQLVKNEVGKKLVYKKGFEEINTSSPVTVLNVNGAGFFLGFAIYLGTGTKKLTDVSITGDGVTIRVGGITDSGIFYVAGSTAASGIGYLVPENSPGAVGYVIVPFKNNLSVEVETTHGIAEFFYSYALFQ